MGGGLTPGLGCLGASSPATLGVSTQHAREGGLAGQVQGAGSTRVGWLQLAAGQGNERAAYELALHFRRQSQPLLASRYAQRAVQLGLPMLPALDHARK